MPSPRPRQPTPTTASTTSEEDEEEEVTSGKFHGRFPFRKLDESKATQFCRIYLEKQTNFSNSILIELPARKPVPQPLPRERGTKTPAKRPTIGTKVPSQPAPGVKGRQTPVKVTTTSRPSITEADETDEEEPLPAKPAPSPRPRKVTPATGRYFGRF